MNNTSEIFLYSTSIGTLIEDKNSLTYKSNDLKIDFLPFNIESNKTYKWDIYRDGTIDSNCFLNPLISNIDSDVLNILAAHKKFDKTSIIEVMQNCNLDNRCFTLDNSKTAIQSTSIINVDDFKELYENVINNEIPIGDEELNILSAMTHGGKQIFIHYNANDNTMFLDELNYAIEDGFVPSYLSFNIPSDEVISRDSLYDTFNLDKSNKIFKDGYMIEEAINLNEYRTSFKYILNTDELNTDMLIRVTNALNVYPDKTQSLRKAIFSVNNKLDLSQIEFRLDEYNNWSNAPMQNINAHIDTFNSPNIDEINNLISDMPNKIRNEIEEYLDLSVTDSIVELPNSDEKISNVNDEDSVRYAR
jgi:hypothetical protein